MMEGNIWQLLAGFVAAMGIPSAIMGLIVWRLEGRISKRERDHEEQDKSQKDLIVLLVQSTSASIALGEATAKAVRRIPDAHCNGDMHAALEYATNIKHKQKEFLTKQGIDALLD
ncbi:MAG: serine/threonine protein kinase [Negativibacillus massiliensis]|uniref:serine/threonine protein kinase n=1 Tax=Negativibacillus massiliensis TaxID=1871035 RepID=UPI00399A5A57